MESVDVAKAMASGFHGSSQVVVVATMVVVAGVMVVVVDHHHLVVVLAGSPAMVLPLLVAVLVDNSGISTLPFCLLALVLV